MSDQQILPNSISGTGQLININELFNGYDILINGYENKIKEKDLIINNLIINNFKKEKDTLYDDVINKSSLLNKLETRINDLEKENNFLKEQIKKFENQIEDNKRQSDVRIKLLEDHIDSLTQI